MATKGRKNARTKFFLLELIRLNDLNNIMWKKVIGKANKYKGNIPNNDLRSDSIL